MLGTMQSNLAVLDERSRALAQALAELRAQHRARLYSGDSSSTRPALTARELQILRLIADGKDNAEIAADLHFALGTIKLHVREILEAMRCKTRAAAAARAVRLGLI